MSDFDRDRKRRKDRSTWSRSRSRSRSRNRSIDRSNSSERDYKRRSRSRSGDRRRRDRSRSLSPTSAMVRRERKGGYSASDSRDNGYRGRGRDGSYLKTYKQFLLTQDDFIDPTVAQTLYTSYKNDFMKKLHDNFYENHKEHEWLNRLYNPIEIEKYEINRENEIRKAISIFKEEAKENNLLFMKNESRDIEQIRSDFNNMVYVSAIPPTVSHSFFESQIEIKNYKRILYSLSTKPVPVGLYYSACIELNVENENDVKLVVETLNKKKIKETVTSEAKFELKVSSYSPPRSLPHKIPSAANKMDRVAKDISQCMTLIHKFETQYNVKNEDSIDVLLDSLTDLQLTQIKKLDLLLEYLRRVYLYDYYAGEQYQTEGDMFLSNPLACVRGPIETEEDADKDADSDTAMDDEDSLNEDKKEKKKDDEIPLFPIVDSKKWLSQVDSSYEKRLVKINNFLDEDSEERKERDAFIQRGKTELEISNNNFIAIFGAQNSEGHYKCTVDSTKPAPSNLEDDKRCNKKFKALDFMQKHLLNKHEEEMTIAFRKATQYLTKEVYDKAAKPYITVNYESGNYYPYNSHGYSSHGLQMAKPMWPSNPSTNSTVRNRPPQGVGITPEPRPRTTYNAFVDVDAPKIEDVDVDYGDF